MKKWLKPRWLIIKLTGLLFAAYSAYNIFLIAKDYATLHSDGIVISLLIVLVYAVMTGYAWTSEVKNPRFFVIRVMRRMALIVSLLVLFALKLRLIDRVVVYIDGSLAYTVLYGVTYFTTLIGLMFLFIYYTFIRSNRLILPKTAIVLPILDILLFLTGLIMEVILLVEYHIGFESSLMRTIVIRPIFYVGLIALCIFFLFPPQQPEQKKTPNPAE